MRRFAFAFATLVAAFAAPALAAGSHYTSLVGKAGYEAMADKELQSKLPKPTVKTLNDLINVSGSAELIGGRFVVFSGCMPHACTIAEGLVVADTETGAVLAFTTQNGRKNLKESASSDWKSIGALPAALTAKIEEWKNNLS